MRQSRMLVQFLLSYLLVLIFPIGVILVYYYPHSTNVVKQKEMDWNTHITEQLMTSMDVFTRYVYNLPFELVQNREIKMYDTEESDYQRVLIANEMRKYNATDGFIDNTLLYIESTGYLFSKTGTAYKVEDFAKPGIGFYYESWPHDEMFAALNQLKAPLVRPAEDVIIPGSNRVRMLTFALPLPVGGYDPPGAVLIQVREDTVVHMMNSMSEMYTGDFYIFDAQGSALVASRETPYGETEQFSSLMGELADQKEGAGVYELDGRSYIVSHTVSDKNGWQYVSLLPVTETLQGIQAVQRNTIILIGLMLSLEFLVIYFSIRKNYHPLKRLVHFASNLFEPDEREKLNELETIRYALGGLATANSTLDAKVKQTIPIMRDNLLFELVSGKLDSWEHFETDAKAYGLSFDYPAMAAAVLSIQPAGDGEEAYKAAQFLRSLENGLPDGLQGYFFNSIYKQETIFLCSCAADFPLKPYLEDVLEQLEANTGAKAHIGIGLPARPDAPEDIHLSYLQAVRATEHLRLRPHGQVLAFDDLELPASGAVSYFSDMLQSLELSILKNDAAAVDAVTERIIAYLESEGLPPHMIRSVYLNAVSIMANGLQRFNPKDDSLLRLTDAAFRERYTMGQMAAIIRESCGRLCEIMKSAMPPSRQSSRAEMLHFIEQNGMNPDFSLQQIADHFGMSPSAFSHHFKKTMGQNFKEHIDLLRIQKSLQLLRSTDQTLEAVSQQTGYTNTSSFIRSFKKIVGTTPGQYRETHRAV